MPKFSVGPQLETKYFKATLSPCRTLASDVFITCKTVTVAVAVTVLGSSSTSVKVTSAIKSASGCGWGMTLKKSFSTIRYDGKHVLAEIPAGSKKPMH